MLAGTKALQMLIHTRLGFSTLKAAAAGIAYIQVTLEVAFQKTFYDFFML